MGASKEIPVDDLSDRIVGPFDESHRNIHSLDRCREIVETYRGYVNLPCVLYSLGVFVFIKYDLVKLMRFGWISRIVNFLNPYTFGIYLLHWFVLEIIVKMFGINVHSIVYRLLAPFAVLAISVFVIWIVQKIPGGKRLIP